ncbi:hypothetical protein AGMMS4957_18590 [Bacteroidia bacterium]|nr:hypothetical protein AGMMS4957_18590 [Bacteroidia bacterium]
MYEFRNLKAEYSIETKIARPDGQISSYSSRIALNAEYQHKENSFLFVMEGKTDIRLDGEVPQKPIDTYREQLGTCLYPMNLCVSPDGEIINVLNFNEIRERWKQTSMKLLHTYYSAPLESYIDAARKNFQTEKDFVEALQRDTFIRLYFQPQQASEVSGLTYCYFPEQDIQSITGIFQGKEVVIQAVKRESKKANRTISMISSLLTTMLLLIVCMTVTCTSEDKLPKGLNVEEIQRQMALQELVEKMSFEDRRNQPYYFTANDLSLQLEIVGNGLKKEDFLEIPDRQFEDKLYGIFKIEPAKKTQCFEFQEDGSCIILFESKSEEDKYSRRNLFVSRKHHFVTDLRLLDELITINDDNSGRIHLPPELVHRNKYLFNNDEVSLIWLLNNDIRFLERLLTTFGYDADQKVNYAVLRAIYRDYRKYQIENGYNHYPPLLNNLFASRDCDGELQIRAGLLKTVANSFVNDKTNFEMTGDYADKRAFYTLMSDYCEALVSDEKRGDDFSFEEKCHIIAAILSTMKDCGEGGLLADSEVEYIHEYYPRIITAITKHRYFGYSNLKASFADL